MNIIDFSVYMTNKNEENFFNYYNSKQMEIRRFGKPLTNTYRNQDYINYLKKRDFHKMIKISKVFEPFCEDKKNKCNVEQNYLGRQCYDKNIVIDELYEESLYKNCPQYAIDYIKEITNELKIIENINIPEFGFMRNQPSVTEKMRSYLVDWLVDVHLKFHLLTETLFMTVNLMDRYLSKMEIDKKEYQLMAITSMLIACKFEEVYPPEIRDFIYISDKSFSKEEIIKMESNILSSLNFDLITVSSYRFLERLSLSFESHLISFNLSQYFLELSLVENRLNYPSSMIATSAIVISRKILKLEPDFPLNLQKASGYAYEMLRNCLKDLCSIIESRKIECFNAVKNKFADEKYMGVSILSILN